MNILMVGPDATAKGGIATVIANFKAHYQANQIFYLATWKENDRRWAGIKALLQLRRLIRDQQIDIVHFHVAQRGSFFRKALLAKWVPKRCRVIFHMHASQFDTFYRNSSKGMQKWISKQLDQLDYLVVLSEEWEAFYKTITTVPIRTIENAVKIPSKPAYDPAAKVIATFGRIGTRKGSYDILQVAKQLQAPFPEIEFILYGDGELDQVKALLSKQQITNVRLGGWIDAEAKQAILAKTVLHLLPSYQEGLPMAILETMSAGIPNLASDVGGIPQVIVEGENGYLVTAGDVQAIVTKLHAFLKEEDLRKKMAAAAFQTIEERFSLDAYFTKWHAFYQLILAENSAIGRGDDSDD